MDIGIRADGLTTTEFENFAIEITKKKFNTPSLHSFKEGKDDGIDGIDDIESPKIIVQAKRWQVKKNHKTAVRLLKEEIDKLLSAKVKYGWKTKFRYVIVTSMGLTPAGLKEIRDYANEKLPQVIPSDDYIIFASSLTTLSQDKGFKDIFETYGLIEKSFSKVLKKQKMDSIELESKDYFSELDFNYFVETIFLGEAYHTLQREHILLIQGPAGIGKTTTCAMLGNLFSNNNENKFDVIVRKVEDIDNVLELYNNNYRNNSKRNLFIVFDDFLGRNKFDVGERILQDVKKLYSASKNSNNIFICLNSRTQILQNAKTTNFEFQKLIDEKFTEEKNFIIDLSKYSEIDKAHIFRKTFEKKRSILKEFDKRELEEKYDLLRGKNWRKIINHRNYFPRLVELIVNNFKESGENFYDYVVHFLNHPTNLYDNLFDNLELEEKYLLFSLLMFDNCPVEEEWLKKSFNTLDLDPTFNLKKSLQKLDGSWITFTKESVDSEAKVDFLNPSIIDFLNDKMNNLIKMRKNIINRSVYLHQLSKQCNKITALRLEAPHKDFFTRLLNDWNEFNDKTEFIGEKMIAIICLDKYDTYEMEFREHLRTYDGIYRLNKYSNGWGEIILQIYFSENTKLKKDFLLALEDEKIVDNILNSHNLNSEDLDNIVRNINEIVDEISWLDEKYYASCVENLDFYFKFRDKKIELLQEFLDDENSLEDIDFINDPNNFDLDFEVDSQTYEFIDRVNKMLNDEYEWKDIASAELNYWDLKRNLSEYLQREHDYRSYEDDAYDRWKDSQLEERVTIESILNKPLS